ncbi:MAG TPA: c-type cytochrome [Burkholderiales bacterium]|jgi:cytochrome c553|nr:c-type cytochrome [Burkholderiales bacterium]
MTKFIVCAGLLLAMPFGAAAQDAVAGQQKAQVCAACHGADGNSTIPQNPILAGQTARYLYLQIRDFKEGRRKDPAMSAVVANLSREDMLDIAAYYAAQKPNGQNSKGPQALAAKGKQVADAALCTMCHLGGFSGQNEVPRAAGQHYEYIRKQLLDFKNRNRTNDAGNMTAVMRTISDEEIDALAAYIASLR